MAASTGTVVTYSSNKWAYADLETGPDGSFYALLKGSDGGQLVRKYNDATKTWDDYASFSATDAGVTNFSDDLDLAIDSNGNLHVVFRHAIGSGAGSKRGVMYGEHDGQGWSFTALQEDSHPRGGINSDNPRLIVDSNDVVHATWELRKSDDGSASQSIRYATNESGSFAADTVFEWSGSSQSSGINEVDKPVLSEGADGSVNVTFKYEDNFNGSGNLYTAHRPANGDWGKATLVDGTPGQANPNIYLLVDDTAVGDVSGLYLKDYSYPDKTDLYKFTVSDGTLQSSEMGLSGVSAVTDYAVHGGIEYVAGRFAAPTDDNLYAEVNAVYARPVSGGKWTQLQTFPDLTDIDIAFNSDGEYMYLLSTPLGSGPNNSGNEVGFATGKLPPPPLAPPDLVAASDSGVSDSDNITNAGDLVFSGTGPANSDFLIEKKTSFGSQGYDAKSDADGNWTRSIPASSLGEGTSSLTVSVLEFFYSRRTSTPLKVTIDTVAPEVTGVSIPDKAVKIGDEVPVSITASEAGLHLASGTVNGGTLSDFTDMKNGNYTATYTVAEGQEDRPAPAKIPVDIVLMDAAGNKSTAFKTPIDQYNDPIYANKPVIKSVSIPNKTVKIGDAVKVTINADKAGLSLVSGTVNGVALDGFADKGGGNYIATYTVAEGQDDRAAGDNIPVSLVLKDAAGNESAAYETEISQNADAIDANTPTVVVRLTNDPVKVGDNMTVTIIANETGLSLDTGTVNGVAVTGFTEKTGGVYTATYTVAEGDEDRAAGDDIPVNFVLKDAAGNKSAAYTTAISQEKDAIDANSPAVYTVDTSPPKALKVGDTSTVVIKASEPGLSLVTGTVNDVAVTDFKDQGDRSYHATYTVTEGQTDVAGKDDIPVEFVLADAAGNQSAAYTKSLGSRFAPQDYNKYKLDQIDANSPVVKSFSIPDKSVKIGDAVPVTINAGEAGLSLVSGTVNGVAVTGFTEQGSGVYTATYTVAEGDTDRAAGDDIPVNIVVVDRAGNKSAAYTTAISQSGDPIDANSPVISDVSIPNKAVKIGDDVKVTIDAGETGLSLISATLNGVDLDKSTFKDNGDKTYSLTYQVAEGHTDRTGFDTIPVEIKLADSAGNESTYTTPISQDADAIDANSPTISKFTVSNSPLKVGDTALAIIKTNEGVSLDSGTINGREITSFVEVSPTSYKAFYSVAEGDTDRAAGDDIPVNIVLVDRAGNKSAAYTTAISLDADPIDANSPTITSVSIPNRAAKVGDEVTVTISAGETGLSFVSGEVNDVELEASVFKDNGDKTYSLTYQVTEGDPDRAAGEDIPVNIVLADSAGNESTYDTAISQDADAIDANSPKIFVRLPNETAKVGDDVEVTIIANDTGLALDTGTVNGVAVTGFTEKPGGIYTAVYTVAEGDTDRRATDDIPVHFVLKDAAGNKSNAVTYIQQDNDLIDAHTPTVTGVSIPDAPAKIGDEFTVTIYADEGSLEPVSVTVNGVTFTEIEYEFDIFAENPYYYTFAYKVTEGSTSRAAGDDIPVEIVLKDYAGSVSAAYTTAISQSNDAIYANKPSITDVSIPNEAAKIGDVVRVTIDAGDAGLSLTSGTVNGVNVTDFSDVYSGMDDGGLYIRGSYDDGIYYANYTVGQGDTNRAAGDDIPVSFVLQDAVGQKSATYTGAISQDADVIDAVVPEVTSVSIPDRTAKAGDAVTVTIAAGEAGLSLVSGQVNGVDVTGFTDQGGGIYTATYTVAEGQTDRAAGDDIPVSFVLSDAVGNLSAVYDTAIRQSADLIDGNLPELSSVSIPNAAMKVGDQVEVTIRASEAGLSLASGTVNGAALTGFTDLGGGVYSATYRVTEDQTDRAPGDDVPVNIVLSDAAGNESAAYTTAISQSADAIDANTPAVTDVTIPDQNAKVGDAVTVTISAGEAGLRLVSGSVNGVALTDFTDQGGGVYSAIYTVAEGQTDRASGEDIPVNIVLADAAGNESTAYTTPISQSADMIDANAPALSQPALLEDELGELPMTTTSATPGVVVRAEAGTMLEFDFGGGQGFESGGAATGDDQIIRPAMALPEDGSYVLQLRATDQAGNSTQQSLAFELNSPPADLSLTNATISETAPGGTLIGKLGVSDPTPGERHTFSLLNSANGLFALNGTDLELADGAALDFDTAASHLVKIGVRDSAGSEYAEVLTIQVQDVQEPMPGTGAEEPAPVTPGPVTPEKAQPEPNGTGDGDGSATDGGDAAKIVTLGDGSQSLRDTAANLNNLTVTDFTEFDEIVFTDREFGSSGATFADGTPPRLIFDTDGDGVNDVTIAVPNAPKDLGLLVFEKNGETFVSLERQLPTLSEGRAQDTGDVNGIINQSFLTGDGTGGFRVTVDEMSKAGLQNLLGVYEVTPDGEIVNARALFNDVTDAHSQTVEITGVADGNQLGFFVATQGAFFVGDELGSDTFEFVDRNGSTPSIDDGTNLQLQINGTDAAFPVWHSIDQTLNSDGVQHALSGLDPDGSGIIIGFEDLVGGGDRDYQDAVIHVDLF
ncbi:Ig-like domain (group 3) [Paracoccus isoporae]|uniref:Ig-like domain (Group 3) n=1 Tax=Paracoccus isoporae TaxID=591205 RepID=A0A1G6T772_9RHOB|nr:Ig-like domain-containing protein [Paracoccus isoporae]SDD24928.1 Ig-like domain (group 3) [Paracoccus isoporae]